MTNPEAELSLRRIDCLLF